MEGFETSWPHAPLHRLGKQGTYFVTVGTYHRQHHFRGPERLAVLHRGLLRVCSDFKWELEAWAVFSNHYHFVARSPLEQGDSASMGLMLGKLHSKTALWVNKLDGKRGRQVWHNFRETRLTYQKSYLARLSYTHQNPVRHQLVRVANQYPWCSARWFERTASSAQIKSLYQLPLDRIQVNDDYEPAPEW